MGSVVSTAGNVAKTAIHAQAGVQKAQAGMGLIGLGLIAFIFLIVLILVILGRNKKKTNK